MLILEYGHLTVKIFQLLGSQPPGEVSRMLNVEGPQLGSLEGVSVQLPLPESPWQTSNPTMPTGLQKVIFMSGSTLPTG